MPVTDMHSSVLSGIQNPNDIKNTDKKLLDNLAKELREMLLANVSNNGGHLASNLGVVELTIALMRVFNFKNDKIVWDVGHQSYVYKILTGRRDKFNSIRKPDGLSGFPKRSESEYDFFNTGHSSTAVSAALGFARASKIKGREEYAIAVVGDGAMTGGMTFEALNDAGVSGENIIVILNDNEMSISKNVGGFAEYFSRMRSSKLYSGANNSVKRGIEKIPIIGKMITGAVHRLKSSLKYLFSQNMLFEEMGFHYLGPVDGHDIKHLEKILNDAKKINGPVLVHAVTVKGKGYRMAEKEPVKYHGVGKFDTANGLDKKEKPTFSTKFGSVIKDIAVKDINISVICPAVTLGCGLMDMSREIPDRFFDVGIAEQHAVTMAAGMSCNGIIPVVSGYSTFMQRAYDQILHDVCLMNLHVIFTLDRAGIVGDDGPTHQGIYDLAYLSSMPVIKVYAPRSFRILEQILIHSLYNENGPVAIRYPKGIININEDSEKFLPGKLQQIRNGSYCVIFSYGKMLEVGNAVAEKLDSAGFDAALIDLSSLKPLDTDGIIAALKCRKFAVCIEDVVESGSISLQISMIIKNNAIDIPFFDYNLGDNPKTEGSYSDIADNSGMNCEFIYNDIKNSVKQNHT